MHSALSTLLSIIASIGFILIWVQLSDSEFAELTTTTRAAFARNNTPQWLNMTKLLQNLWMLGSIGAFFATVNSRALHDFVAGTIVVEKEIPRTEATAS